MKIMKFRLDYILLCVLWLLAITLGTCFWFNTVYGFNIFSGQHWQYLSYMQAAQTPVRPGFYISLVMIVFIAITSLYFILRPRRRKIKLPIMRVEHKQKTTNKTDDTKTSDSAASTLDIISGTSQSPVPTPHNSAPSDTARPPRLNLSAIDTTKLYTQHTAQPASAMPQPQQDTTNTPAALPQQDLSEIQEIFESAGYVIKPHPRINNIPIALIAIGTNENIWIGGVGIKTTDIRAVMDRLNQIFTSTLDETDININGFVIAAPDAAVSEFQDVLMFDTVSDLRKYMNEYPNPPLPDDDDGMFDAYSQYIDAVINHIGIK